MKNPLAISQQFFSGFKLAPDRWDRWSQRMVTLSILAFLPLQVPQIWSNALRIHTQDPAVIADLQVIPVLGYGAGIVANLLLMCYLADRQERWGALVQLVGILTSGIVVTQLFSVDLVNPVFYSLLVILCGMGIGLNLGRLWIAPWSVDRLSRITQLNREMFFPFLFERSWLLWKSGLNLLGLTLLPLILTAQLEQSFFPTLSLRIGIALSVLVFALGSITLLEQHLGINPSPQPWLKPLRWLQHHWGSVSGWTANLLFMFGPAAQLLQNILHPESIAALSLTTQMLSVLGNLLILSRSGTLWLQGHDRVWAVGGLWEVTVRGFVLITIAYFGFMPWLGVELYWSFLGLYGLWIYHNAQGTLTTQETLSL